MTMLQQKKKKKGFKGFHSLSGEQNARSAHEHGSSRSYDDCEADTSAATRGTSGGWQTCAVAETIIVRGRVWGSQDRKP